MHIAHCRVLLNPGHDLAKRNVTPAEVLVLRNMHQANVGKDPIHTLEAIGDITRSNQTEVARLRSLYGPKNVDKLFPGVGGEGIPSTFEGVWPAPVVPKVDVPLVSANSDLVEEVKPFAALEPVNA